MNDSFLEDLELVRIEPKSEKTPRDAERNITRRRSQPSPLRSRSEQEILSVDGEKPREKLAASSILTAKVSRGKSAETVERQTLDLVAPKSQRTERISTSERKSLTPDSSTTKKRLDTKERPRWSAGSVRENSRSSDLSSKENSRPSESSRDSVASRHDSTTTRERGSGDANLRKKSDEKFEIAMLNSVKEIVGTYTRNESTKILRAMQEIYINSQANMIKMMLRRSEESTNEANSTKESPRLRILVEENASLRDALGRALEESEGLRRENIQLKLQLVGSVGSNSSKENSRPSANSSKESSASKLRSGKLSELCKNSK